jgi:hypothetical protein
MVWARLRSNHASPSAGEPWIPAPSAGMTEKSARIHHDAQMCAAREAAERAKLSPASGARVCCAPSRSTRGVVFRGGILEARAGGRDAVGECGPQCRARASRPGCDSPVPRSEPKRRCFMPKILRGAVRDRLLFPAGLPAASYRPAAPRTHHALEPTGCEDEGAAENISVSGTSFGDVGKSMTINLASWPSRVSANEAGVASACARAGG